MTSTKEFFVRRTGRRTVAAVVVAAAVAAVPITAAAADRPARDAKPAPTVDAVHAAHHRGGITSASGNVRAASFDLVKTNVRRQGDRIMFTERLRGRAGAVTPKPVGKFAGSSVLSYVWPISLDPSSVGFTENSGVLALAATSHPDFDDTPLYDENGDGRKDNDGVRWHAHWVVLVPDTTRPDGALKVRDILPSEKPKMPKTWPGVPIYLDSPAYRTRLNGRTVKIEVPAKELGFPSTFSYDGVTAALKVNADLHDPLLRVENVFDIASGDLSLPGTFKR